MTGSTDSSRLDGTDGPLGWDTLGKTESHALSAYRMSQPVPSGSTERGWQRLQSELKLGAGGASLFSLSTVAPWALGAVIAVGSATWAVTSVRAPSRAVFAQVVADRQAPQEIEKNDQGPFAASATTKMNSVEGPGGAGSNVLLECRPRDLGPVTGEHRDVVASGASTVLVAKVNQDQRAVGTEEPSIAHLQSMDQESAPATLFAEIKLLKKVHRVLRGGEPKRALRLAREHRRRFVRGALNEERVILEVEALCESGYRSRSRELARAQLAKKSRSPFRQRLRDACRSPDNKG